MPQFYSYNQNGSQDSFADFISNISPEDTFLVSASEKSPTNSNRYKWQIDALDKVVYDLSASHAILEGANANDVTLISTQEHEGITQIFRQTFAISDSALATAAHGRENELKYQLKKAGAQLKNIMEVVFSSNQAKQAPTDTKPALTDGLLSLIAKKDEVNPNLPTAQQADSAVHIEGALDFANFDKVANALYKAGSKASYIIANPANASKLVTVAADAVKAHPQLESVYTDVETFYGKQDVQVFTITDTRGKTWQIVYSRFAPVDVVYFVNPEDIKQRVLREPKATQLGKQGSYEHWQLVIESGLVLVNPFAAGAIVITKP